MNMSLPSRIALVFFVVICFVFIYLTWEVDEKYALYIIPGVVGIVVTYILSPQIDWWFYNRNTPDLSEQFKKILVSKSPIYENLTVDLKTLYRKRIYLFMMGNDFTGMAGFEENIPEDIKFCLSTHATLFTLNSDTFLFPNFEKIIIYQQRFPSPQYPTQFHSSELFEEDGCLLFDATIILKSTIEPYNYFNPVLYEYYKVFKKSNKFNLYPSVNEDDMKLGEQISGFTEEHIDQIVGLPNLDNEAILATYYFVFPERFRSIHPLLFKEFNTLFNLFN